MSRRVVAAFLPLLLGCKSDLITSGDADGSDAGTGTSSSSTAGTTSASGTSGPTSGTAGGTSDTSSTSGMSGTAGTSSGSGGGPTGGGSTGADTTTGGGAACSPALQDCSDDQRCIPVDSDADGVLDAGACVDPPAGGGVAAGGDCTRSDDDDCAEGLFCLAGYASADGEGSCLEFCDENDSCGAQTECTPVQGSTFPLCAPDCDPLLQDCVDGWTCQAEHGAPEFSCLPVLEAGGAADECDSPQHCAAGLACLPKGYFNGCTGDACCSEYCAVGDDSPCSTAGSTCLTWAGNLGPGHEDVGACKK